MGEGCLGKGALGQGLLGAGEPPAPGQTRSDRWGRVTASPKVRAGLAAARRRSTWGVAFHPALGRFSEGGGKNEGVRMGGRSSHSCPRSFHVLCCGRRFSVEIAGCPALGLSSASVPLPLDASGVTGPSLSSRLSLPLFL